MLFSVIHLYIRSTFSERFAVCSWIIFSGQFPLNNAYGTLANHGFSGSAGVVVSDIGCR